MFKYIQKSIVLSCLGLSSDISSVQSLVPKHHGSIRETVPAGFRVYQRQKLGTLGYYIRSFVGYSLF